MVAFREKRSDTLIKSIEATHKVELNVRDDMELGSLLRLRGFESQSQLLKAYRGGLLFHPRPRTAFLSFHWNDYPKVRGLRLMFFNKALALDIEEASRKAVRSENENYVRAALKRRIEVADVLLCILGNNTGLRTWVDWEVETAFQARIPICAVRIPGTYGRLPQLLKRLGSRVAVWEANSITATIEESIARGCS